MLAALHVWTTLHALALLALGYAAAATDGRHPVIGNLAGVEVMVLLVAGFAYLMAYMP